MVNKVAFVDDGAVLEMDLVEIAADAGADRHLVDRLEPPDEFVVLDDVAHHRLGGGDDGQVRLLRPRGVRRDCGKNPEQRQGAGSQAKTPIKIAYDRKSANRLVHVIPLVGIDACL